VTPDQSLPFAPAPPPPRSRFALALIVAGVGGAGFLTVGVAMQLLNVSYGLWFTELLIFLGVPWLGLSLGGWEPLRTSGLSAFSARSVGLGFLVGVVNFFALVVPLQFLAQRAFPKELVELFDSSAIFRNQLPLELGLICTAICFAAPLCEELFFRGVFQPGLLKAMATGESLREAWPAIALSGFVFSAFHLDPVGLAARWELGFVFGVLAWKSRSLWPAMAAHCANNSTSMVIYLLSRNEAAPDEEVGGAAVAALFLGGSLALAALVLLLRRSPQQLAVPVPAEDTPGRRGAFPKLVWALGALWLVATVALVAFDWRGVLLNGSDALSPVKAPKAQASAEDKAGFEALVALRSRARSGEAPIEEYRAARSALSDRQRGKHRDAPKLEPAGTPQPSADGG
jgi:membrane protease YdiL (CAAX protease family)